MKTTSTKKTLLKGSFLALLFLAVLFMENSMAARTTPASAFTANARVSIFANPSSQTPSDGSCTTAQYHSLFRSEIGLSKSTFDYYYQNDKAEGFWISNIECTPINGTVYYSYEFTTVGTKPLDEVLLANVTYSTYRSKYDELWSKGYRLQVLNNFVLNGVVKYTAVFHKLASPFSEIQYYEATYDTYRAKYDQLWSQGWRLAMLNTYVVNGEVRYTAVWRPSTASELQLYGWTFSNFETKRKELYNQGWRIQMWDTYVLNNQIYYTAVFRGSSREEARYNDYNPYDFTQSYSYYECRGWDIKSISAHETSANLKTGNYTSDDAESLTSVSPNPTTGIVFISGESVDTDPLTVAVCDSKGQIISTYDLGEVNGIYERSLDLSHLQPDCYVLQISTGNTVRRKKLVITR